MACCGEDDLKSKKEKECECMGVYDSNTLESAVICFVCGCLFIFFLWVAFVMWGK